MRLVGCVLVLVTACVPVAVERQRLATAAVSALLAERGRGGRTEKLEAARALWRAGQQSSAARRYLELLLASAAPEVATEAAERLASVPALIIGVELTRRLASLELPALPAGTRAKLLRQAALAMLQLGEQEGAERVLSRLPDDAEAHYLRAAIRLRAGDQSAARRELLRSEQLGSELGRLGLARLDASEGKLAESAGRYESIGPTSPAFFWARQELAWLELQRGAPERALAQTAALLSPVWRRFYRPDREFVESAALLGLCRDRAARNLAQAGRRHLERSIAELTNFLRQRADVRLYYVEGLTSVARKGPLAAELATTLLVDASFYRTYRQIRQLQRERRLLLGGEAAPLLAEIGGELDARLVLAQRRAGELARQRLESLRGELSELRLRIEELIFDLDNRGEQHLIARRAGGMTRQPARHPAMVLGRQQRWPFQGEYWLDEQRDFISGLLSRCPSGSPRRPSRNRPGPRRRRRRPSPAS